MTQVDALRQLVEATRAYLDAVNGDDDTWSLQVRSTRGRLATAACNALPELSALLAETEPSEAVTRAKLEMLDEVEAGARKYHNEHAFFELLELVIEPLRAHLKGSA